ncbi:hypothetical protein GGR50DRAFT_527063 [Xylaria sp. CBS 124048]|nr:hypothetical protein GGR50DRAFT_527063 [Xylaria sp. CBS 124048]
MKCDASEAAYAWLSGIEAMTSLGVDGIMYGTFWGISFRSGSVSHVSRAQENVGYVYNLFRHCLQRSTWSLPCSILLSLRSAGMWYAVFRGTSITRRCSADGRESVSIFYMSFRASLLLRRESESKRGSELAWAACALSDGRDHVEDTNYLVSEYQSRLVTRFVICMWTVPRWKG